MHLIAFRRLEACPLTTTMEHYSGSDHDDGASWWLGGPAPGPGLGPGARRRFRGNARLRWMSAAGAGGSEGEEVGALGRDAVAAGGAGQAAAQPRAGVLAGPAGV